MTKQTSDSDRLCFQLSHGMPGFLVSQSSWVSKQFEIFLWSFIMFFCSHNKTCLQVFPTKFTSGGIYKRTIRHCFPYCFLEILWGDKALMKGNKVVIGGSPTRENPSIYLHSMGIEVLRYVVCLCFKLLDLPKMKKEMPFSGNLLAMPYKFKYNLHAWWPIQDDTITLLHIQRFDSR